MSRKFIVLFLMSYFTFYYLASVIFCVVLEFSIALLTDGI